MSPDCGLLLGGAKEAVQIGKLRPHHRSNKSWTAFYRGSLTKNIDPFGSWVYRLRGPTLGISPSFRDLCRGPFNTTAREAPLNPLERGRVGRLGSQIGHGLLSAATDWGRATGRRKQTGEDTKTSSAKRSSSTEVDRRPNIRRTSQPEIWRTETWVVAEEQGRAFRGRTERDCRGTCWELRKEAHTSTKIAASWPTRTRFYTDTHRLTHTIQQIQRRACYDVYDTITLPRMAQTAAKQNQISLAEA